MNEISSTQRDSAPDTQISRPLEDEPAAVRPCREVDSEEMGAASFPASDPPATWTWDPR